MFRGRDAFWGGGGIDDPALVAKVFIDVTDPSRVLEPTVLYCNLLFAWVICFIDQPFLAGFGGAMCRRGS
jgi:hypothetical protein